MRRSIVLLALLLQAGLCHAQFSVSRFAVAGGGGSSSGAGWSVTGTMGQADAEVVPLCSLDGDIPGLCAGASYRVSGGFWWARGQLAHPSCHAIPGCIFRDGFEDVAP